MGAPVSFPVLCIVNSAVITVAFRRWLYRRGVALFDEDGKLRWDQGTYAGELVLSEQLPYLVNGDDCVMTCGEDFVALWEQIALWCGLESSIGKSYYDREWLIMNSAAYTYNAQGQVDYFEKLGDGHISCRPAAFQRHPFLPFGSLFCLSERGAERRELKGSIGADALSLVGPRTEWAVEHCPPFLRDAIIASAVEHYKLKQITPSGVSYYLPRCLGGLGLPLPSGVRSTADLLELVGRPALLRAWLAFKHEELVPLGVSASWEGKAVSDAVVVCEYTIARSPDCPHDPFTDLVAPGQDYSPLLFGFDEHDAEESDGSLSPAFLAWMQFWDLQSVGWVAQQLAHERDPNVVLLRQLEGEPSPDGAVFKDENEPYWNTAFRDSVLGVGCAPLFGVRILHSPSTHAWSHKWRGLGAKHMASSTGSSTPPEIGPASDHLPVCPPDW
jgi:hypothetical protein